MSDIVIPHFRLDGNVIVITGGTKGLGYGMALTLANYGADVVVASRSEADCKRVSEEIRSLGRGSLGIVTDTRVPKQNEALVEKTVAEFGRLDIMIASAGCANTVPSVDMTEQQWDEVVDTDLKGVFFSSQAAAKKMIALGKGGKIIQIASAAAFSGSKGIAHYCAAKAGVVNLTRALAVEWARYRITVNAVCPGYVPTSINEQVMVIPGVKEKIEAYAPLRRLGKIEEIAAPVLMLCSDFSGYMTGTSILIDGGGGAQ